MTLIRNAKGPKQLCKIKYGTVAEIILVSYEKVKGMSVCCLVVRQDNTLTIYHIESHKIIGIRPKTGFSKFETGIGGNPEIVRITVEISKGDGHLNK